MLSGNVQIPPNLSSRPQQIIANAMNCGVEGPCVFRCEGRVDSERTIRKHHRASRRVSPAVELPHSSQNWDGIGHPL